MVTNGYTRKEDGSDRVLQAAFRPGMTDDEVLTKWRARRGDEHLTLSQANELEKLDRRFNHLGKRQREAPQGLS